MASIDFQKWLNELREMPSSASQWEFANQFIEYATQIIVEKQSERNELEQLRGAIENIIDNFSDELESLKLQDGMSSLKTSSAQFHAENVLGVIESLKISLVDYKTAREKFDPSDEYELVRQNFANLEQAGESAKKFYSTLYDLLEEKPNLDGPHPDTGAKDEPSNTPDESGDNSEIGEGTDFRKPEDETPEWSPDGEQDPPEDPVRPDDAANKANEAPSEDSTDSTYSSIEIEGNSETPESVTSDGQPSGCEDGNEGEGQPDGVNPTIEGGIETTRRPDDVPVVPPVEMLTIKDASGPLGGSPGNELLYGIEDSKAAANRYLKTSSLHDLEIFMWSLIAEDDLSAAYWVARHLSELDYENILPPELLKAVQGSRWLVPDSNRYVEDLFEFQSMHDSKHVNNAQELMELAASLRSSLIAPHSNMWGLLRVPATCPASGPIVLAVSEFAGKGYALRPEYIEGMGESVRKQDEIVAASAAAKAWLEGAPTRRYHTFQTATNVWVHLTGDSGKINELLAPVKEDDRSQVQMVREKSDELAQDPENLVNRIGRSLAEGPWNPITGRARNWLLNGIAEANNLAERWYELVEYERDVREKAQDQYLIGLVTNLRSEVQRQSRQFVQSLQELTTSSNPMDIASATQCALRSTIQMLEDLDIDSDAVVPDAPVVAQDLIAINRGSSNHDLAAAVGRRLLWTDTIGLGDAGVWTGGSLEGEVHSLAKGVSESMSLDEAIKQRFGVQDFRFFEMMTKDLLPGQVDNLNNRRQMAQQDSLVTLASHLEKVKERVSQAVRDGVIEIDDDNWIMYDLEMSDIADAVDAEEEILNYASRHTQLQGVQEGIERLELQRQNALQKEWNETFSGLDDNASTAVQAWQEKFDAARDDLDIRVMEDCVIRLNDHSRGEPLPAPNDASRQNPLTEFVAFVESISDIEAHVKDSRGLASLQSQIELI